ncbi:11825_t:CDS:1 [Funneliformis mosseae]|uniref:11825_t:CDS:1 n=1 Tax=Funneliformis mosseae TaxID=27381 RepID=A0A9N9CAR9_FUNMO|nr:11825_t:CDS:1 [Funneliformis mosseae]
MIFMINQKPYVVICIITLLLLTLCIISQAKVDAGAICEANTKPQSTLEKISTDDNPLENVKSLLSPVIFIFNLLYTIVSYIFSFILYVLSPVFWILEGLFNVFILTPYTITQKIYSYFYPLYMFLTIASIFGFLVGGMAGWFSEVIAGVLTTPSRNELSYVEQENERKRTDKLKRRVQALANMRARNGGRMPEEFYDKYMNAQNRQGMIQRGQGYPYQHNNNMEYRGYTGIGEN